jgi:hypothetical protein
MIYTLILKPKFRNTLRILAFIILVAFSVSIYSCQTVYTESYTPENFNAKIEGELIEVTDKTDSIIDFTDYSVTYREKYKDSSSVLIIKEKDPYLKYSGHPIKLKKSLREINLNDIKNIKVERKDFDLENTLIFSGIILVAIVMIGIIGSYIISANIMNGMWSRK